ncbi:MAG: hypothetical protein WAS27_02040 [Candidatus Saccharimonadales bacterium]
MISEKRDSIPIIESDVFQNGNHTARFAIGITAIDTVVVPGREREFQGAAELRSNIYLKHGFVRREALNQDGTELDDDDRRSVHFVVLEQAAASLARVIGNMRLIIKSTDTPLPVESLCPDVFKDTPVANGGTEVSRLISQHEDSVVQQVLKWPMFIAGVQYVDAHDLGPTYGLLGSRLASSLVAQKVPITPLAEDRYIPEINTSKRPVEVNVAGLKDFIRLTGDQGIDIAKPGFSYLTYGMEEEDAI